MLQIKTKMGARGQLVIPKIVRESLGFVEHKPIILKVEGKSVRLLPAAQDVLQSWSETAKREGVDVSKEFIYGDRLYEGEF